MNETPASRPHEAWLHEQLRDPGFAADYFTAAAEDVPAVCVSALRQIAEAHGLAKVAATTGIPAESLCRGLGPGGSPRLSTLMAVVRAAGMRFDATPHERVKRPRRRGPATEAQP